MDVLPRDRRIATNCLHVAVFGIWGESYAYHAVSLNEATVASLCLSATLGARHVDLADFSWRASRAILVELGSREPDTKQATRVKHLLTDTLPLLADIRTEACCQTSSSPVLRIHKASKRYGWSRKAHVQRVCTATGNKGVHAVKTILICGTSI